MSRLQTFSEHWQDLRRMIISIAGVWGVFIVGLWVTRDALMAHITMHIDRLIFLSPSDALMANMKVVLFCSFILSLPVNSVFIWKFFQSALTEREVLILKRFLPAVVVSFIVGVTFSFYVVMPYIINFMLKFASSDLQANITVNHYLQYLCSSLLAFGVVFEMPVVIYLLAKMGIASREFLVQKRRYVVVGLAVVSAFITPPDIASLLILYLPLILLYEVGVLVVSLTERQKF